MPQDLIYLGPAPAEESCAQVGTDHYVDAALRECKAYIQAIRIVVGPEPEGAKLRVKWEPHDYGKYAEVVLEFDGNDAAAAGYAYLCDEMAPVTWEQAGMTPPVAKGRGRE